MLPSSTTLQAADGMEGGGPSANALNVPAAAEGGGGEQSVYTAAEWKAWEEQQAGESPSEEQPEAAKGAWEDEAQPDLGVEAAQPDPEAEAKAWEEAQQARIDEVLEEHAAEQKDRRGSMVWDTMIGLRKSAAVRRQSVTTAYLNMSNRVQELLSRKGKPNTLMKIAPEGQLTTDEEIDQYLTGVNVKRRKILEEREQRKAKKLEDCGNNLQRHATRDPGLSMTFPI